MIKVLENRIYKDRAKNAEVVRRWRVQTWEQHSCMKKDAVKRKETIRSPPVTDAREKRLYLKDKHFGQGLGRIKTKIKKKNKKKS